MQSQNLDGYMNSTVNAKMSYSRDGKQFNDEKQIETSGITDNMYTNKDRTSCKVKLASFQPLLNLIDKPLKELKLNIVN